MKKLAVVLLFLLSCGSASADPARDVSRGRMLTLALEQAEKFSPRWIPEQRDCAGFVRFLFREAVTGKSSMWRGLKGHDLSFVSADQLLGYNFELLGRSPRDIQLETGDVLAFYREGRAFKDAWHLMVVLRAPTGGLAEPLLIYHNGESAPKGAVRKIVLRELEQTGLSEWGAVPRNPQFLGVYRWKNWVEE